MIQAVSRGMILAVCFMLCAAFAQAQQYAALVMDARTGKVIKAVNADTRVHPASLTKMMTLYIVFDEIRRGRLSLDQKVTVSKNAAAEPPSRLGLRAGQKIEVRYLIRAAAIKSANDAATALGEAVAGSEEAFAARMNAYARAMGLKSTTFRNAHGLTREGHMSTARDMAVLGRRLVYDFPQYYNIFGRTSTSAGIATVRNTNRRLLEAYPGADGIKTGYTRAAGFNLVSSAQRGDRRVIVALLGGKSTASRNAEVARLMDLGFASMPAHAKLAQPAPLRGVAVASAPASGAARLHRRRGRAGERGAGAGRRRSADAAGDGGRLDRARQRDHRGGDRRGERRARPRGRRRATPRRWWRRGPGDGRPMPRPTPRASRADRRRRLRLDLRGRRGRAAGARGRGADRGGELAPAPPAATTGACSSAPTAPRATPSGSC